MNTQIPDVDKKHDDFAKIVDLGGYPGATEVPLLTPFVDDRGVIQNLLLKPVTSVAVITSKKGSVRANHYHKSDMHYAYVVSGKILYFEREIGSKEIPEPFCFGPGQMFFTPQLREHSMLFAEDTVFVTLARNERSHEVHEEDLVRIEFITPEIANRYLND